MGLCVGKEENPQSGWRANVSDPEISSESERDEVSNLPQAKVPTTAQRAKRRSAVSAEVVDLSKSDFVPKVVKKSASQRKRIEEAIEENFLFSHVDQQAYNTVVDAMFEQKFKKGDTIILQGTDATEAKYFYIIESGNCDIFKNDELVLQPTKGDSFGELALMYNAPRAATVKAATNVTCWALDRDTFRHIIMLGTKKKRDQYDAFLKNVKIFASLDNYEIATLADALKSERYNDGDEVITQGDEGTRFYIVEHGVAESFITQKSRTAHVGTSKKGDYFGEIALISNKPRAATVKAKGDLKVLYLERKDFERLLGPVEGILKRNMEDYETFEEAIANGATNDADLKIQTDRGASRRSSSKKESRKSRKSSHNRT